MHERLLQRKLNMACNLQLDSSHVADFTGKTGDSVSVSVKGTSGDAVFTGGFYAGAKIPINPATFVIKAGDNLLDLVVENTLSGDITLIVCDADGSVLDRYRYDRNNPVRIYDVRGV
jgi:hypothetical protein